MPSYPDGHILLPPGLPPYLKVVYELKQLVGDPKDDEVIGIHAVIRMAQKAVDKSSGSGVLAPITPITLGALERSGAASLFRDGPLHLTIDLEPITGAPSDEEIIKVQSAIRAYQHFASVPSIFDPHVDMELSQHLFNIQMASYTHRVRQTPTRAIPQETLGLNSSIERAADVAEEPINATINAGTGATAIGFNSSTPTAEVAIFREAIERSNQLIERSNLIAERANQLTERSSQSTEQSTKLAEKFNELFEKFNDNSEKSNSLAETSTKHTKRLGDNHKGNTVYALDCLVNKHGETPGVSETTGRWDFATLFKRYVNDTSAPISILIDGVTQEFRLPTELLADFLCFYGIEDGLCEPGPLPELKPEKEAMAGKRLRKYWASCLG